MIVQHDIHTIDAEGKAPGRVASEASTFLIGKHKVDFISNIDAGDHVQVVNAAKMKVDENKMEQKVYYHHTGYAHGLKQVTMKRLFEKDPSEIIRRAVSRMLPKNKQRTERMKRLTVKN